MTHYTKGTPSLDWTLMTTLCGNAAQGAASLRAGPWPVGDSARTVHYSPPLRAGSWPVGCDGVAIVRCADPWPAGRTALPYLSGRLTLSCTVSTPGFSSWRPALER